MPPNTKAKTNKIPKTPPPDMPFFAVPVDVDAAAKLFPLFAGGLLMWGTPGVQEGAGDGHHDWVGAGLNNLSSGPVALSSSCLL